METITLDQYCKLKNVNWIDLLKIDTEGLDLEVLRSGESLIKSGSIEYIKIEINCSENNLAEIVNYLTEFNYALIGTFIINILKTSSLCLMHIFKNYKIIKNYFFYIYIIK